MPTPEPTWTEEDERWLQRWSTASGVVPGHIARVCALVLASRSEIEDLKARNEELDRMIRTAINVAGSADDLDWQAMFTLRLAYTGLVTASDAPGNYLQTPSEPRETPEPTIRRDEWQCKCGATAYKDNDGKSRVCWTGRLHTCAEEAKA